MAVAALVLGVGWAHETLLLRGITERALDWVCSPLRVESSWWVDEVTSVIALWGEPSDVQRAFATMQSRILEGPYELPSAQITRQGDPDHELLRLRYGNQSYGLGGAARYGHQSADPAAIRWLLQQVGSNTTLIVTGEVELGATPFGETSPLPEPSRAEMMSTPGVAISPVGFGVSWVAGKTPTAAVASELMIAALATAIPDPGPTLESVRLTIRPLGLNATHVAVVATDTKTSVDSVNAALADLLRLCTAGPDVSEIVEAIDRYERRYQLPPLQAGFRTARADLLAALDFAPAPEEELNTDLEVLQKQVQSQCNTLLATCRELPAAASLSLSVPTVEAQPAVGQKYRPRRMMTESGMSAQGYLEADDTALSFCGSETTTLAAHDLVLVERHPDGERSIYGRFGQELFVDPLLWKKSSQLIDWIDQRGSGITVTREERLPPSPYVSRAALRSRPGIALVGGVVVAIVGVALVVGAIVLPDDRAFKALFGLLLVAAGAWLFKLGSELKNLARRLLE